MKRIFLILFSQCILLAIKAQEFSFQLFFNDAFGNKDTITVGYDANASNGIDSVYGEMNIITQKNEKPFDVRISDEWKHENSTATYHTKKQIVKYDCRRWYDAIQGIDIFSTHWPVTMQWDTSLFEEDCRKGSILTCIHPGGWWDTGCPSNLGILGIQQFRKTGTNTFNSNNGNSGIQYGYVNEFKDTIAYYFLALGPENILEVSTNNPSKNIYTLVVTPNPASDKMTFQFPLEFGELNSLVIQSLTGQIIFQSTINREIEIVQMANGVYFVSAQSINGKKAFTKFIKE